MLEAFIKLKQQINNMARFDEVKDLILSLEGDFDKFYNKGNQAAGTRVRKGMQDLKTLAQDIRSEVQNKKNAEA
ncbi:hypothetical protein DYBT9275_00314 [Dyadobacter sp. CECT 9275]|uniref:Histone H1 n=2 Tax=Dyadobacter helix TaxID=2822344 RepID=A0A916J6U3_9BACT|nr:hypothetical protein DYBT9275_00314 [Dyadobacter sp. CECT 9275]